MCLQASCKLISLHTQKGYFIKFFYKKFKLFVKQFTKSLQYIYTYKTLKKEFKILGQIYTKLSKKK